MSIITRMRKQHAVYWGSPVKDGRGGYSSFAAPVEIDCRWDFTHERAVDKIGQEFITRGSVYPDRDLDEEGFLWLGTLAEALIAATGSEEIVNGGFSSSASWTLGAGWQIASGKASIVAYSPTLSNLTNIGFLAKKDRWYQTIYTMTAGGTLQVYIGAVAGTARTAANTYTETVKAAVESAVFLLQHSGGINSVDDVSAKDITGYYDPQLLDRAVQIRTFGKTPNFRATEFLRTALI